MKRPLSISWKTLLILVAIKDFNWDYSSTSEEYQKQ